MKKISLVVMSFLTISVFAAAQAYEGNIQYDKKKQAAIAIDYSYPPDAVENAIIKRMERIGYKGKEEKGFLNKDKGFLIFKNAYITDISSERMDYVIKVERKSRKESDESELHMIMMKGDDNALGKMSAFSVRNAKLFLNEMLPDIEAAYLEIQIKDQEETVAKAEKKLQGLKDDQASLEKKLQDNRTAQETTQKDIEAQRQALGTLIGNRKN